MHKLDIQEKTIKLGDIIKNSAILRPRTKFRSLPEHFSSILCMRVRSQERTIFRAPPNRLSDSFRLRLLSNVRYTHRRSRIAADSIFSAIIAVPLFADVHQTIYLMEHPH